MVEFKFPRPSFRAGTVGFGVACAGLFGLALFLGIADIGFRRIGDEVLGAGIGLPAIVLVHLAQVAFCALAWAALFRGPRQHGGQPDREVSFRNLFFLRWVRESIDSLLPVAQVGGEVAAARILSRQGLGLPVAGASIIADVTIETLTQAIFTLIGLALIFTLSQPGDVAHWAALGLMIAVVLAALAVLAQRWGGVRLFERLLLAIADRTGWNRLEGVAGLDEALGQVYTLRDRLVVAGLSHLMAWSLGAVEILVAAQALGHHLDFGQSYVMESLAQAVRSAAFFVPGALGVQEGGIVVLAALFGIPADAAVSISLMKRIRELALGVPGLAAWQAREFGLRQAMLKQAQRIAVTSGAAGQDASTSGKTV